jgi:glycerol kinase
VENQYILSIDQGTSGTKAILFDQQGGLVYRHTTSHRQYYPKPGWVEHDPEEIYVKTLEAIEMVLKTSKVTQKQIIALSITNQRETVVVWDKNTGKPVYNAVVWQCQRSSDICSQYKKQGYEKIVKVKTGLVLAPYFSATKVKWILDNIAGVKAKAEAGELLFGTIDTWLIWKLTGGRIHATDYSNACRTLLFNINELKWDRELLELFAIPESLLPIVKSSNEIFGYTAKSLSFEREIPITGVIGDSQAALFGQNCFKKGIAKATYGTGSSIMMNIGKQYMDPKSGLVTSLAWGMNGEVEYIIEGNINCTGATVKWLVDGLELIPNSVVSEQIASSIKYNDGVYLVPAFTGLGAPYWDDYAKGIIIGMTLGTSKAHIVRAALESIAYQIKDVLDLMVKESWVDLKELRVDGGAARNDFLMQFQADMLGVPVVRPRIEELSAMGSAFIAGLALGYWKSIDDIKSLRTIDRIFASQMNSDEREKYYSGWKEAVRASMRKH